MHNASFVELFSNLADADVAALRALGTPVRVEAGQRLFALGSEAGRLYLVERGRIDLTLPIEVRGEMQDVLVEERSPGQLLGWSALIPPHQFTLDASAPVATDLLAFRREALEAHFAANPRVGHLVMCNLGRVVGHRLQVLQAMWAREMRRLIERRCA